MHHQMGPLYASAGAGGVLSMEQLLELIARPDVRSGVTFAGSLALAAISAIIAMRTKVVAARIERERLAADAAREQRILDAIAEARLDRIRNGDLTPVAPPDAGFVPAA